MTGLIIAGIVVVLLFAVLGGLLYHVNNQIVDVQLETHKTMFPAQIRHARRFYRRSLYRQHPSLNWAHRLSWTSLILALFTFAGAVMLQFNPAPSGPSAHAWLYWLFVSPVQQRNILFWVTAGLAALASALWWWQDQRLAALISGEGSQSAADLYWTPPALLKQQQALQYTLFDFFVLVAIALALAGQAGWLPAPQSGIEHFLH